LIIQGEMTGPQNLYVKFVTHGVLRPLTYKHATLGAEKTLQDTKQETA
jgi:hypothetical protein